MKNKRERHEFRRERVKRKLALSGAGKPRLCVHRSSRHLYAQIFDDAKGVTLAAASSMDKELRGLKSGKNIETAKKIGALIGKRAAEKGIREIRFDRNGFKYHGRIKALADAAREAGLKF